MFSKFDKLNMTVIIFFRLNKFMMHRIRMRGFIFIGRLFILKETKLVLVFKKTIFKN